MSDVRNDRDDDLETELGKACAAAFTSRIDAGEVDVVELPDDDAIEIQADEWTLHLEGNPVTLAFMAIENEPEHPDELISALRATLVPDDLLALQALDAALDGLLTVRLAASNDALSATLAGILAH